jgi:hypothetical protein
LYGGANVSIQFEGWGDADWANDVQTRRFTIGFTFTFRGELFPNNLENKKMLVSLPLKLSTLLPLQLLRSVLGYVNSLQF